MKYKTTRAQILRGCANVRAAGYCDLQHLLRAHEPQAYTAGIYGWNFDIYEIYGVTICTGYRGMPGTRCKEISEFDEKAREVWDNYKIPYEMRRDIVENLLRQFCKINGGY